MPFDQCLEGARKNIFPEHNKDVGVISAGMCATYIMPRLGDKSASNETFILKILKGYLQSRCEDENRFHSVRLTVASSGRHSHGSRRRF